MLLGLAIVKLLTFKFYVSVSTNFNSSCSATLGHSFGTDCASCDSPSAAWTPAGASYNFAFSHYRKPRVHREPPCLPCAFPRAHGEQKFCRAPRTKHTANRKHTATREFAVCTRTDTRRTKTSPCTHQTAHGEMGSTLTAVCCSSTPSAFAVCQQPSTWRPSSLTCALGQHTAKSWPY